MRYFEKCVTSGSCLHLTVQKSRLWSYQKVIRLSSLIQSKLLEIIVDYIRGEQLRKVSLWLGHSSLQTTEMYLRADPTDKLDTLEKWRPPSLRKGKFKGVQDELLAILESI